MFFIEPQYSISIYYYICTIFWCVFLLILTIFISIFHYIYKYVSGFFISFFISLYYLNTFTEANFSWLIYESIKALEIKTLIVSNLAFPSNTILSCSFLFFLIIYIDFLIAQVLNPTTQHVITIEMSSNEASAEIQNVGSNRRS